MRRTAALVLAVPLLLTVLGGSGAPEAPSPAPVGVPDGDLDVPASGSPSSPVLPSDPEAAPGHAAGPPASEGSEQAASGAPSAGIDVDGAQSGSAAEQADEQTVSTPEEAVDDAVEASPLPTGPVERTFVVAAVPDEGAIVGTGRLWRYTIEVEGSLGVDVEEVAAEVRAALTDDRSWARTRTLEQVDDPTQARIRVVLASPDTVDELCGRAGLRTVGIYSCWNGRFAALNSWRWEFGADGFPDIGTYRSYLVNHEFGHGLGYGHVDCPTPGAPAPVMMQQSMRLGGCVANGWPYP